MATINENININVKTTGLGDLKSQSDLAKDSLEGLAGGLSLFGVNTQILQAAAMAGDAAGKSFQSLGEASGTLKQGTLGLGGAFNTLFNLLKANPFIVFVGIVLSVVEGLKALYGRVEFITTALNGLSSILSSVGEAFSNAFGMSTQTDLEKIETITNDVKTANDKLNISLGITNQLRAEEQKQMKLLGKTEEQLAAARLDYAIQDISNNETKKKNLEEGISKLEKELGLTKESEQAKLNILKLEKDLLVVNKEVSKAVKDNPFGQNLQNNAAYTAAIAKQSRINNQILEEERKIKDKGYDKDSEEVKNLTALKDEYSKLIEGEAVLLAKLKTAELELEAIRNKVEPKKVENSKNEQKDLDEKIRKYIRLRLEVDRLAEAGRAASADLTTDFTLNELTADDTDLNKSVFDKVNKEKEKAAEESYQRTVAAINGINQVAQAGLSEYAAIAAEKTAAELEKLNEELVGINDIITEEQNKYQDSLEKTRDLESKLGDARGNRRKRLLEDIAAEKKAQEESKKAELKALELQKKKEAEIRNKETQQKITDLKIETAAIALQIGIISALAIAKHFSANAPKDPTFGITTIATGAAMAIAIAANVAKMRQLSKNMETYEQGGLIEGPSHRDGGVKARVGGGRIVELEGDEFVVNKNSTRKHRRVLENINADKFQDGGIVLPDKTNMMEYLSNREIYVSVVDINSAMGRYAKVIDRGRM